MRQTISVVAVAGSVVDFQSGRWRSHRGGVRQRHRNPGLNVFDFACGRSCRYPVRPRDPPSSLGARSFDCRLGSGWYRVGARSAVRGDCKRHRLPDGDGCSFLRKVKKTQCRRAVAVAVTAWTTHVDRTRAKLAGFHLFLNKPIDLDRLRALLSTVI